MRPPGLGRHEGEIEQELGDLLDHALECFRRHFDAAVALGQRHHADGQRIPGADALAGVGEGMRRLAVEPGDLRRAAADIEHDDRMRLGIDEGRAARDGEISLGLAVDDLQLEVELVAHAVDEGRAVLGEPAGLGGDETRAPHILRRHLLAADAQRIDGASDGIVAETVAEAQPLAQPHDARKRIDDAEAEMRRLRNEKAAIVRAEVERGVASRRATPGLLSRRRGRAIGNP